MKYRICGSAILLQWNGGMIYGSMKGSQDF